MNVNISNQKKKDSKKLLTITVRNFNLVLAIFVLDLISTLLHSGLVGEYWFCVIGALESLTIYMTFAFATKIYFRMCICHYCCYKLCLKCHFSCCLCNQNTIGQLKKAISNMDIPTSINDMSSTMPTKSVPLGSAHEQ